MTYNDFQILNNESYSLINEHYNNTYKDRNFYVSELYKTLNQCISFCSSIKEVNINIKKELANTRLILNQIKQNLYANFSIKQANTKEILEFNIFSFLNKLINILNITTNWFHSEEKIYYKTFIKNTNLSIINILEKIFNLLEKNNIILFKHM